MAAETVVEQVVQALGRGEPIAEVARAFALDRKTVRAWGRCGAYVTDSSTTPRPSRSRATPSGSGKSGRQGSSVPPSHLSPRCEGSRGGEFETIVGGEYQTIVDTAAGATQAAVLPPALAGAAIAPDLHRILDRARLSFLSPKPRHYFLRASKILASAHWGGEVAVDGYRLLAPLEEFGPFSIKFRWVTCSSTPYAATSRCRISRECGRWSKTTRNNGSFRKRFP